MTVERVVDIVVGTRLRPLSENVVAELMESIGAIGLMNPIVITKSSGTTYLVAGMHRLEAVKRLGHHEISCTIMEGAESDDVLLGEIDENLIRRELSLAERAIHIGERKKIYERKYPQTKHGGAPGKAGGGKSAKEPNVGSFVEDTALIASRSKASVRADATRFKSIPQIRLVAGTCLDKGRELDALSKLEPETQEEIITRAKAGEKVSAIPMTRDDYERKIVEYDESMPDRYKAESVEFVSDLAEALKRIKVTGVHKPMKVFTFLINRSWQFTKRPLIDA